MLYFGFIEPSLAFEFIGKQYQQEIMTRQFLTIFIFVLPLNLVAQVDFDCKKLRQQVKDTRNTIDSLRESKEYGDHIDTIEKLNEKLYNYLSALAIDDRFQSCDLNLKYDFYYLRSSDKRFCITSWDTKLGGTMIDYTTTVIYKTKEETKIKTLKYGDEEFISNSQILFDTLLTLKNSNGNPIYIVSGFGQSSTALPYRVLKAFMVMDDGLVEDAKLFPDNGSQIWIQYDRHHFRPNDVELEFLIRDGAKQLKVPIVSEEGRPTGKYYKLKFNGLRFIRE